jgi:hypothetical protein
MLKMSKNAIEHSTRNRLRMKSKLSGILTLTVLLCPPVDSNPFRYFNDGQSHVDLDVVRSQSTDLFLTQPLNRHHSTKHYCGRLHDRKIIKTMIDEYPEVKARDILQTATVNYPLSNNEQRNVGGLFSDMYY